MRFDLPREVETVAPGAALRPETKTGVKDYPAVDRSRKGDPLIVLRPSLSRRGGDVAEAPAEGWMFGTSGALPASPLIPGRAQATDLEAGPGFVPHGPEDKTTTERASAANSPPAGASGQTGPAEAAHTARDGSTPAVPRAVALASTTPAPADATPIEIAAAPVSLPGSMSSRLDRGGRSGVTTATRAEPAERPRYADLIAPENLSREQRCLAEAVYFEARSEPENGQAAVAQVVLNRVKSGLYPSSVCGVVYQNRHRYMACQFSFACEGKSLRITDSESWQSATRVAKDVLEGKTYLADVGGATHYHADYVKPGWARRLLKMDVIGRHIFYKLRADQP